MRHQKRVAKLGLPASHRKAVILNLVKALLTNGKIRTTDARAKELRRVVERLITYAKRGTVHHRRLAFKQVHDRTLVKKLFEHIAPQYASRNSGYTRLTKLGYRDNDNAAISLIEFVDYRQSEEEKKAAEQREARKVAKAKKAEAAAKAAEAETAGAASEEEHLPPKKAPQTKQTKAADGERKAD